MLQNSTVVGMLFLSGIAAGCLGIGGAGTAAVAAGAAAALTIATAAGFMRKRRATEGLTGFNAILTGCAVFTFLQPMAATWALLAAAALLTLPLKSVLDRAFSKTGCSSLTLPFILATWAVLLTAQTAGIDPAEPAIAPTVAASAVAIGQGALKGLSQIFLIDSWVAGCIFLAGLWAASRRAALLALAGSAAGMAAGYCCGCPWLEISQGLWGFSPALTAIAVGHTFRDAKAGWLRSAMTVTAAVMLTVVIQMIAAPALAAAGLPVLTIPFCAATWIMTAVMSFPRRKRPEN